MKNYLTTVFVCASVLFANAQGTFVKGYIVNDKKDTIKGEVKLNPKKESEAYEKIYFKDANGGQKTYKAAKLIEYGVGNERFISLDYDGEPRFYKVLAQGAINFYVVLFETMRMNELSYDPEYYLAEPGNKEMETVKQNKFKKQLSYWMKDNMEFMKDYEDTKKFDVDKATQMINNYNAWKAGK